MAKVSRSYRLEAELLERIEAQRAEGETNVDALTRALEAGLDALESGNQAEPGTPAEGGAGKEEASSLQALQAVIDAKSEHIASLEKQLQAQNEQVVAAINSLQASNAAQVTGDIVTAKLIESTEAKKQGRWARAWAAFTGKDKEAQQ